jgi:hypothetical protein
MRWLDSRARAVVAIALATVAASARDSTVEPRPVLWAWERVEDVRFAGAGIDIAVLAGSIVLSGDLVEATGRRYPAYVLPEQHLVGVVHIEIDRGRALIWGSNQREAVAAHTLALVDASRFREIQIDFEVRASERDVLLDVLRGVRAGLAPDQRLSMTALASWCDTERWLSAAPVDEIVPMLFRMGPAGERLKRRLADGGDFGDQRCRGSIGIATDTPPYGLPRGRRVFIFNPRSWDAAALGEILRSVRT